MILPEICIRRPVFATVLSLGVLLLGLISYQRLPVREYPKIDEPVVSVETTYKGASPEVIESQVTKPLEDSLSGIEGLDVITSSSRSERSSINVRFRITVNPDNAAADVRDKVARVRARLPADADEPVIAKVESDAVPVLYAAMFSTRHTQLQITDYVNRYVRPRLQVLPGASDVRVFGERKPSMRIWLDAGRLASYRLTTQDVEDALRRQNVEIPAGRIESRNREFAVVSQTDLRRPEEFGAIILRDVTGYPVRLRDVARIAIGPVDERGVQRFNGNTSVGMGIIKQATANPLDLALAVRREAGEIRKALPEGMEFEISYDTSVFIQHSIKAVFTTITEAVLLVALVIFFFLRSVRATIIPLVTIPVSLVGTFGLMYLFGFTINTLTLLAMVLAVGLVVDDAIVVLENIYRRLEAGVPRLQASIEGAREIAFAVLAMTLTLAAVYAPLAFATGRTGRLFIEFALALAGAVVVSGFVALTLSPMMCSQILRHQTRHGAVYNHIERFFVALAAGYRRSLDRALHHRVLVVCAGLVVAATSGALLLTIKSELAPTEDRGVIFGIVSGPEGATIRYTAGYIEQIEKFYQAIPERGSIFGIGGFPTVADGMAILRLKPWDERQRKQQDIAKELQPKFFGLPGVFAFPANPPSLGQSPREKPLQFVLLTQSSFEELQRLVERMTGEMAKNPGLANIDADLKLNTPEIKVTVNRDKISDVGANVETVGRTLETMLGGRLVTRYKQEGEQYDVIVQIAPDQRETPDRITELYVRGKGDQMVQLANLLAVREAVAPKSLNHFNRLRSATITANLNPGYTLGEAIGFMQSTAKRVLPPTVQTDLAPGQSREFRDSSADIYFVFVLALAFIYLVLAAQFESFVDPFVIMFTVPLSMTGALGALWLSGGTLNVYSQIGLITLVGLITKHGILIVEFANQMQERGKSRMDAVIEAATLRLRPILMTTGAMVLGAIPLALATGAGSESRQQIGWVIVGGLLLGTMLTLFVVPTAYTLLARKRHAEAPEAAPAKAAA
ncbi:MAG: efflux RND transporter permease subunit [Betaproteobacteria bacterium]|nr:efflux RND transporter permease subunit [Betaproteobacteria bacterium]